MSMFDNADKDYLYDHIKEFLEDHSLSELIHIIEVIIQETEESFKLP